MSSKTTSTTKRKSVSPKSKTKSKKCLINLRDLRKRLNELPKPVVKHSRRVMLISKYILRQFELDDWYLDERIDQEAMVKAIYFHDVGKTMIAKEYIYKEMCNGPAELHKYNQHVELGLALINPNSCLDKAFKSKNSFETYLFDSIKYHHSNEENIPIAGLITFIANTIDNMAYIEYSDVSKDLTTEEYLAVLDKVTQEITKRKCNEHVVEYFHDSTFIAKLVTYLKRLYCKYDLNLHFGINIENYPIYDIYKYNDSDIEENDKRPLENYEVYANVITYSIRSRYYALIKHNDFAYIANKSKNATFLDNYFIDDLTFDYQQNHYDFDKLTFLNISFASLNKVFIKRIYKFVSLFNLKNENIALLFDLFDSSLAENKIELIKELKEAGFKIALNNVQLEYIDLFKQLSVDYAFYDNFNTHEVDSIFVDLIQSLGIIIILTKKVDEKFRYVVSNTTTPIKVVSDKGSDEDG